MRHGELGGNFSTLAFAEHVDAAWIDGICLLRPGDQLIDRLHIGHAELLGLRTSGEQHVVVANSHPQEGLPDGEDVGVDRGVVLGKAEEEADLPGRIGCAGGRHAGRGFDHVTDNGLSSVILELGVGRGFQGDSEDCGTRDSAGKREERCIEH